MINWLNAYRAISSKAYRVVMDIICGVFGIISILIICAMQVTYTDPSAGVTIDNASLNTALVIMVISLVGCLAALVIFSDYFIFSGMAARHTGIMSYVRSSFSGEKLVEKAVLGDFVHTLIRTFIAVPCAGIAATSIMQGECTMVTVFTFLSVWGAMMMAIEATNLITRRYGKTLAMMVIFTYVGVMIYSLGAVLVGVFAAGFAEIAFNPIYATVTTVVLWGLAILFFILSKKDIVKAYKSGYEDRVGGK